ncbi:hypothetical protein NDU88_003236 [Pleurodeles waltl]|uniref:Uncharacterized protein n=1 Tax=Pleurodeles waltl TaxID=8319 RepID=A0AAV7SCV7_PLEWA|nr:hypothetical protein NDU88_003236 [Pleurodeles waltl]
MRSGLAASLATIARGRRNSVVQGHASLCLSNRLILSASIRSAKLRGDESLCKATKCLDPGHREKLGRDDAVEVTGPSVKEVGGDRSSRPKRSHIAASAAFLQVKRRRNGKTPLPASSEQTSAAVVSSPVQMDVPEPPALVPAPLPVTQGVAVDTIASPIPGLEGNPWPPWHPQRSRGSLPPLSQG